MGSVGEVGRLATAAAPRRVPVTLVSVAAVAALIGLAMAAVGSASPAVAFQPTGHWVFNQAEGAVAHVDGGTNQVDARVDVPDVRSAPLFTLQGEKQGFVVGRQTVTVFGRSTLTVDSTFPAARPEIPVGIEVQGGPYLIYRKAGTVVRLGVPPTTIQVGAEVGRPSYTDDGTVWLHRIDDGALCALRRGTDRLDCVVQVRPGPSGALTVVSAAAAFLDTADDAAQILGEEAPGRAVPVGVDLPGDARIADRDTQGRLPVVVGAPNRLLLTDSAGIPAGRAGGAPIAVDLKEGTFSWPVASGGVIAVVEETRNRLLVFDVEGRSLGETALPPGGGPASITRGGDGRLYVDDADGAATHVIGPDGKVTPVATGGAVAAVTAPPAQLAALVSPPPVREPPGVVAAPPFGGGNSPVGAPPPVPSPIAPPIPPPVPRPPSPPSAPSGVGAALGPNGAVVVTWSPADGHGLPLTYAVVATGGRSLTTAATTATFTGLPRGAGYAFVVTATTSAGTGPPSAPSPTVTLPALLQVTTTTLPEATRGAAYAASLAATGGVPAYRWSVSGGALPGGLTLQSGGGISGTPTSGSAVTFTVTVADRSGVTATKQLTLPFGVDHPLDVIGDLNGDRKVGCLDVNILKSQYNRTGPGLSGDLNGDQTVDITDLSILMSHYDGDGTGSAGNC